MTRSWSLHDRIQSWGLIIMPWPRNKSDQQSQSSQATCENTRLNDNQLILCRIISQWWSKKKYICVHRHTDKIPCHVNYKFFRFTKLNRNRIVSTQKPKGNCPHPKCFQIEATKCVPNGASYALRIIFPIWLRIFIMIIIQAPPPPFYVCMKPPSLRPLEKLNFSTQLCSAIVIILLYNASSLLSSSGTIG